MWILALDASMARCSAALLADAEVRAVRMRDTERGHPSILPPLAAEVLAESGVAAEELDAVAAVVGPGGFTGLRTALALAQGIALGAGLPVVAVTTGEALAEAVPEPVRRARQVWTAIDTRRGRVMLERFAAGSGEALGPPAAFTEAGLPAPAGPVALAGDAAPQVAARLAARGHDALLTDIRLPDAVSAARVAARRLAGLLPPLAARPLYVEPPAVRQPPAAGPA